MGDSAVPSSLPLANMTDAVRELIDPDFHPELEQFLFGDESPRFLKPLSSRIASEDVEYLRSKGALTIPEPSLRKELLKAYVQWVYSSLPVLDLHSFLEAVAQNDPDANISLLLFQAVMFAGTAFVDLRHLQAAGFKTRREARKAFYNNTRVGPFSGLMWNPQLTFSCLIQLLYAFDYEDDRIAIIQSILLMTYYYEKEETLQKDIWHWVGVCYTQAQSIGLHRDPSKSNMSAHTKRLRIRLWWCLYSRDRLIALALRRPTQINEGICNVPLIALTDFDIRPFDDTVDDILLDCSYMGDTYLQRRLAIMFIETVKLCQCLGRVLFAQYTPSNCVSGTTQETTITLVPRQASDAELQRCSQKLDAWLGNLPEEATCVTPRERKDFKVGDDVLLLHASMLQMIYHATCTALYRPRASSNITNTLTSSKTSTSVAQKKIRDAASEIADTVQRLRNFGLTPYLPTYGLTVMIPAAVAHLTDLKSSNPTVRDESKWNFRLCIEIISDLRDIYPAADYETACLEKAFQLQHGQQPMLASVYVMQNTAMNSTQAPPTFVNATELDLSILRHKHQPSRISDSPTWDFNWAQDHDILHRERRDSDNDCWTVDLDNTLESHHFLSRQDPAIENTDDGIPPHILMVHDDNDIMQLQSPDISSMVSREGETMITGDLERDLGFL